MSLSLGLARRNDGGSRTSHDGRTPTIEAMRWLRSCEENHKSQLSGSMRELREWRFGREAYMNTLIDAV